MIKKVEVRRRLALYEDKLKKERQSIFLEMQKLDDACTTVEMKDILHRSKDYAKLYARFETLHEVLIDIGSMRLEEMFDDDNM